MLIIFLDPTKIMKKHLEEPTNGAYTTLLGNIIFSKSVCSAFMQKIWEILRKVVEL